MHDADVHNLIPKWTHTVLQERSFVSEWKAQDAAFHLAHEVSILPLQCNPIFSKRSPQTSTMPDQSHPVLFRTGYVDNSQCADPLHHDTPKKCVNFSDVLCIRIGEDTSFAFQDFQTHVDALHSVLKPWTLLKHENPDGPIYYDRPCEPTVSCNRQHPILTTQPDLIDALHSNQHHEHPMHPVETRVQMQPLPCRPPALTEVSNMFSCTMGREMNNHKVSLAPSFDVSHRSSAINAALHTSTMSELRKVRLSLQTSDTKPMVACKAVRHEHTLGRRQNAQPKSWEHANALNSEQTQPPITKVRLEHESPIAHLVGPHQEEDDTDDEQMEDHDQPIFPAFVNYLTNRLEGLGLNPHDNDFDLAVRTWYIDHRTIHRWTAPRILQLVGPPRGWEAQIQSLWVDQLNNDDWFDAIIVEPDPPRSARHAFVVYDMIVTQSLDMPRFASMVTVLPGRADTFQMYSVACSLPEVVSGYELVQAADAGRYCRHADCLITYRWIQIPNTLRPTHQVGHGDGFQIVVHDQERISMSQRADDASSSEAITASPTYSPGRHAQSASSNQPARFTTVLHLFQLDGVEVCCQVLNDQRIMPTQEIADALNIPLDCLEAIHVMPHTPFQMPEYDMTAVVQRTGDLSPNTMDRLLLVDIIYHHHPDADGVTHRPTLVREVQRVGHQILRQQILLAAAVHHYCILVTTQCVVTFDDVLWPEDDYHPRPVRHGSYAQVIVPPPPTHDVPTQMAVEVAHQTAENDEELVELLDPPSADDTIAIATDTEETDSDAVQLDQIAAQYRNVASFTTRLPLDADQPPRSQEIPMQNPHAQSPCVEPALVLTPQAESFKPCTGPTLVLSSPSTQQGREVVAYSNNTPTLMLLPHQEGLDALPAMDDRPTTAPQRRGDKATKHRSARCPKQLTITSFFGTPSDKKARHEPKKQTTINQFFEIKTIKRESSPQPTCMDETAPGSKTSTHEQLAENGHSTPADNHAVQARTGHQHEAEPPTFEARIPSQPVNPEAPRPRPLWHIELNTIFLEEATTYHRETGPEMSVEVWYVHHAHMPTCRYPRLIRLDDIRDLWYADLCNAWFDQLRRHQPVRVHIVKPTPPYQMRRQAVIHIILEQGMIPEKAAILFTAAFHGGTRMGLLQQAESSPVEICTDQAIRDHGLQPQCDFRPCNLFSGRFRFHHHNPERVPSGISVLLDVGDHRHQTQAQASTDLPRQVEPPDETDSEEPDAMDETASLMQRPRFKAFPKPIARTGPVTPPTPASSSWFTIYQPIAPTGTSQHQPVRWATVQVRNLADFHMMLQWLSNRAQDDRCQQDTSQAKIATWYLEPHTMPRSDHYRDVLLSANPSQWPSEVLQRWADILQPSQPVDLFVVQPDPPGGTPDIFAHVIVAQNAQPGQAAALVSVTELLEDPWHPSRFALFLHSPVTSNALFEHAGIPQDQVASTPGLSAYHGTTHIPHGSSYPVRSGFAFEVVTDSLDFEEESSAMLQIPPSVPSKSPQTSNMQVSEPTDVTHVECCEQIITALQQLDTAMKQLRNALGASSVDSPHYAHMWIHHAVTIPTHRSTGKAHPDEDDLVNCYAQSPSQQPDTQHRWQQLAAIRPKEARPMAPILTWYVDHERFPQCFAPREVFVTRRPHEWQQVILQAWEDTYLPANNVEIVIVLPDPVMMEAHIVAHVMVLQQQAPGFTTTLLTTLDSAAPGVRRRHATIVPVVLSRATLLALAFHPQECEQASHTCDAWVGDEPLDEHEPMQLPAGLSCTAALHRHPSLQPGQPDPWDSIAPRQCPHRVPLCLQAILPPTKQQVQVSIDDDKPQLLWFANEAWKLALENEAPLPLLPLPDGLIIPEQSYWSLLQPPHVPDAADMTWCSQWPGSRMECHRGCTLPPARGIPRMHLWNCPAQSATPRLVWSKHSR